MTKPKQHDSDSEVEVDPEDEATTARLDMLSAYTMFGRMQLDGLLAHSVRATAEEVAPLVEPPAGRRRRVLLTRSPARTLGGRVSQIPRPT